MTLRTLVLAMQSTLDSAAAEIPADALLFVPDPTVGGAWTELRGGREVIRFGYRPDGQFRWLRLFDVPAKGHNVATQAIERIVFARGISEVVVLDKELVAVAKRGTEVHPAVKLQVRTERA